jgi:hypothetical protein
MSRRQVNPIVRLLVAIILAFISPRRAPRRRRR